MPRYSKLAFIVLLLLFCIQCEAETIVTPTWLSPKGGGVFVVTTDLGTSFSGLVTVRFSIGSSEISAANCAPASNILTCSSVSMFGLNETIHTIGSVFEQGTQEMGITFNFTFSPGEIHSHNLTTVCDSLSAGTIIRVYGDYFTPETVLQTDGANFSSIWVNETALIAVVDTQLSAGMRSLSVSNDRLSWSLPILDSFSVISISHVSIDFDVAGTGATKREINVCTSAASFLVDGAPVSSTLIEETTSVTYEVDIPMGPVGCSNISVSISSGPWTNHSCIIRRMKTSIEKLDLDIIPLSSVFFTMRGSFPCKTGFDNGKNGFHVQMVIQSVDYEVMPLECGINGSSVSFQTPNQSLAVEADQICLKVTSDNFASNDTLCGEVAYVSGPLIQSYAGNITLGGGIVSIYGKDFISPSLDKWTINYDEFIEATSMDMKLDPRFSIINNTLVSYDVHPSANTKSTRVYITFDDWDALYGDKTYAMFIINQMQAAVSSASGELGIRGGTITIYGSRFDMLPVGQQGIPEVKVKLICNSIENEYVANVLSSGVLTIDDVVALSVLPSSGDQVNCTVAINLDVNHPNASLLYSKPATSDVLYYQLPSPKQVVGFSQEMLDDGNDQWVILKGDGFVSGMIFTLDGKSLVYSNINFTHVNVKLPFDVLESVLDVDGVVTTEICVLLDDFAGFSRCKSFEYLEPQPNAISFASRTRSWLCSCFILLLILLS